MLEGGIHSKGLSQCKGVQRFNTAHGIGRQRSCEEVSHVIRDCKYTDTGRLTLHSQI